MGTSGFPISLGLKIYPPPKNSNLFLFIISFRASQLLLGILLGSGIKGKEESLITGRWEIGDGLYLCSFRNQ